MLLTQKLHHHLARPVVVDDLELADVAWHTQSACERERALPAGTQRGLSKPASPPPPRPQPAQSTQAA